MNKLKYNDRAYNVTEAQKREIIEACNKSRIECDIMPGKSHSFVTYSSSGMCVFSLDPTGRLINADNAISADEFIERCRNGVEEI